MSFKIIMPTVQQLSSRLKTTQKFIDNEILRKSEPYVPLKTGMLRDSGIMGTKPGSGRIRWITPYAHWQYYNGKATGKRGRYWVKRAMTAHGKEILRGAQKKLNGK